MLDTTTYERAIKSGGGATCYWQIAGNLRATEQMKAAQRTSNNSIIYYETKSEYDAIIPAHDPLFLSDNQD